MEKRAILLMLSLEAVLVVAGLSAAAASSSDTDAIIRLHSSSTKLGFADMAMAMARLGGGERPWSCCNLQICTLSYPLAYCMCLDKVEQCSDACKNCEEVEESDPQLYVCKDVYYGRPAPICLEEKKPAVVGRRGGHY